RGDGAAATGEGWVLVGVRGDGGIGVRSPKMWTGTSVNGSPPVRRGGRPPGRLRRFVCPNWAGNSVENVEKPTLLAHPDGSRFRRRPAAACRLGLVGVEAGAWRSLVALGCLEAVARAGTGAGVDARIGARSVARSRR